MPLTFKLFEKNKKLFLYIKAINDMNDNDLETYKKYFSKLFNKKIKFRCIYDVTQMNCPSMTYINKMSQFINETRDQAKEYLIETVVFVNSFIIKNIINVLFTLAPPVSPYKLIDNEDEVSNFIN